MRRLRLVGVLTGALLLVAGTALADTQSGSTEHHEECTTDPETNEETCITVFDNDVSCGTGQDVGTPAGTATVSGLPDGGAPSSSGELEVCSDDSSVVQGRVIASGSATDRSGYVAADGDQDNPEQGTGWARVDGDSSGSITIRCGDAAGNLDATHPTDVDGQDDCGS
jgi:hypothetical protein